MEGKERLKKETDDSRLVGGRFNKQGNLQMRLVLGGHRADLHIGPSESEVYTEALTRFSHIHIQSRQSQQLFTFSRLHP